MLYPIAYLIQASLSVGDPQARPPEGYGLDNFTLANYQIADPRHCVLLED